MLTNTHDTSRPYRAIYFSFGRYEEGDGIPPELIGFDCPFDDSPTFRANNVQELEAIVKCIERGAGKEPKAFAFWKVPERMIDGHLPDVIIDEKANLLPRLYERICGKELNRSYSMGRESLETFWTRERWRWE